MIADRYRSALSAPPPKGGRNAHLLGAASLAVYAGRTKVEAVEEIGEAWGYTPTEAAAEVGHAYEKALALGKRPFAQNWRPGVVQGFNLAPVHRDPPPLGAGAASYVSRMIQVGQGATASTLAELSPVPVPSSSEWQAQAFADSTWRPFEFVYAADTMAETATRNDEGTRYAVPDDESEITTKKTATVYRSCFIIRWSVADDRKRVPTLASMNPLTGQEATTGDGRPSLRCASAVAVHRYALAEFDELPLAEQMAFWAGVIRSGTLPLHSLVYSGGKSIHALITLGAATAAAWRRSAAALRYALANQSAPTTYRADVGGMTDFGAAHGTRLPGAWRPGEGGRSGAWQTLLWLAPPPTDVAAPFGTARGEIM